MTATPGAPATGKPDPAAGKLEKAPSKFLAGIKRAGLGLVKVAVDQFRKDPALVISGVARGATLLFPKNATGIAAISAGAIRATVSPAKPDASPVQAVAQTAQSTVSAALDRLNRARGR